MFAEASVAISAGALAPIWLWGIWQHGFKLCDPDPAGDKIGNRQ